VGEAFDGLGSSATAFGKGASKTLDAVADGEGLKLCACANPKNEKAVSPTRRGTKRFMMKGFQLG
jgi:hypothetical protein